MRVLIFGCGYVGLALGTELARQGHQVFGVRRHPGQADALRAATIEPLTADLTRPESLAALPAGCDWVVNCVSSSGGGAEDYRAVYLQGMRHLLAWLTAAPPQKLVYTSSTGVYGQTDGSTVTETSPAEPATEAGQVLVQTEEALLLNRVGVPAVILRLAGIYGPGRGYWLKQFLQGEARIEGDGGRILNMVHRDDVVGAVIAALQKGQPGEVYNAVDDEPVSQLECFQWLAAALGRSLPPSVPEDQLKARRRGLTSKRVSNQKLKTELGYAFKYPTFREGWGKEVR